MSKTAKAIGIDLGTTYSCVGGFIEGNLEVIPNSEGQRITPSTVGFNNEEGYRLIGSAVETMMIEDPSQCVYDAKRLIGRGFDDPILEKSKKNWPFRLIRVDKTTGKQSAQFDKDAVDNIKIELKIKGETRLLDPTQISAAVLSYLKGAAETKLGEKNIEDVVITVPAHFNDNQRAKTQAAGRIAGFKNIRLLNEPTAAALAYGYGKLKGNVKKEDESILVFDLGGGTFDVSLLDFQPSESGSLADVDNTDGDTFLGGVDFDERIYNYCTELFERKHKISPSMLDDSAKRRLRVACENAKRRLSSELNVKIDLMYFHEKTNLNMSISRAKFEDLSRDLFKRTFDRVKGCLIDYMGGNAQYDNNGNLQSIDQEKINQAINKINKVLLVGGSTRIPKVVSELKSMFGEAKICSSVHPDEAVALGAAYHAAAIYSDTAIEEEDRILLLDTVPLNIAVETYGGVATTIIPKGSTIPVKKEQTFTTYQDNQQAVTINICEGIRPSFKDNHMIGTFNLSGIQQAPRGVPQIVISCQVDNNGILTVEANDTHSNKKEKIEVTNLQSRLSPEEIEKMIKEGEEFAEADAKQVEIINLKNQIEQSLYELRKTNQHEEFINSVETRIDGMTKEELQSTLQEIAIKMQSTQQDAPQPQADGDNKVEEID